MGTPIIQIRDLRKVYRVGNEQVVALDKIDLVLEEGQVVCVVGTSGSGKSTLLNMLAGLEKPTRGRVVIGNRNISKMSEDSLAKFRQKYIGFVFQSYNLMQYLSALENVALPLTFRGMDKKKRETAAKKILTEVGLGSRLKHTPNQMSGGQQQRVGIARAFVARPKIIFADEPTGNLDTRTTIEVMRMMVKMCREYKQTLVLVTHDIELAQYADRIITIIDGNIVKDVPNISIADSVSDDEAYATLEREQAAQRAAHEILEEKMAMQVKLLQDANGTSPNENETTSDEITAGQTDNNNKDNTAIVNDDNNEGVQNEYE